MEGTMDAAKKTRKRNKQKGVYVDKDGRIWIDLRWRDPKTGRKGRYGEKLPRGTTMSTAQERARLLLNAALKGEDIRRSTVKPLTIGEAIDDYLKWSESERPRSMQSRKSQAAILKRHLGTNRPLTDISQILVERFKRDRRAEVVAAYRAKHEKRGAKLTPEDVEHVGAASINRALAILKHMLDRARRQGQISAELVDSVREVDLVPEPAGRSRHLTPDEETRLLSKLPNGVRPIVIAANLSGMRRENVVKLRRDQVDLRRDVIMLGRTKNGDPQEIPIAPALRSLLEPLCKGDGEYVFVSRNGKPYTLDAVTQAFSRAARRAGIKDVRFHDTRHTFATRVRDAGAGIDVIQKLLNHSSITMAQRYAKVGDQIQRAAVANLTVAKELPNTPDTVDENRESKQAVKADVG
jgi:integrase